LTASIPLVDLRAQYAAIRTEVDLAMQQVVEGAAFVLGQEVSDFEADFAAYCGTAHAIAVDSGISALELGMRALGIGVGDEVITPVNSFIASSSAISFTGATPIWVDCLPGTYNLDPDQVKRALSPRTRGIMPVHLYGQPADMDVISGLAAEAGVPVIEDACQAHGASYRGRRAGSLGTFGAFSFYPGKNLGAYGDGGCITTDDADLAARLRMMRNYGQSRKYVHETLAWNRRLDTLQAAVLQVKLRHLDDWNLARRGIASQYDELLAGRVGIPARSPDREHVFHQYVVEVDRRDEVLSGLHAAGVGAGIHYPVPIHLQPAYSDRRLGRGSFPVAEAAAGRVISLPMYPELGDEQVSQVAAVLAELARRGSGGASA
jgi:dTDP-4-amino-4,6-dideoxygalactose transaminase